MSAEKPHKEPAGNTKPQTEHTAQPFADRKRNLMTIAVVGGLMIVEGIGIVVAVKMVGGEPHSAVAGEEGTHAAGEDGAPLLEESEVAVTELMAFNNKGGPVYVYQISVYAQVPTSSKKVFEAFVENRQQTIEDRFSKVVRAADPKFFDEPGLETIRRQFKHELSTLVGDESIIQEILFPEFSKLRAD